MSNQKPKPTIWQVIGSVLAAFFGVQSTKARERDFSHGNPVIFVLIGVVAVVLFVLSLYFVAHWITVKAQVI